MLKRKGATAKIKRDRRLNNGMERGQYPNPPPLSAQQGKVKLMDGERIVFTEESNPQNYLKLIASGDVDETMLEALEDYVKRQKKRLAPKPVS
jgi:hypothetical protein